MRSVVAWTWNKSFHTLETFQPGNKDLFGGHDQQKYVLKYPDHRDPTPTQYRFLTATGAFSMGCPIGENVGSTVEKLACPEGFAQAAAESGIATARFRVTHSQRYGLLGPHHHY